MLDFLLKYSSVISAIMPLIVIIITGLWVNSRLEKIKSRLQLSHSIIEKRAEIYASVQFDINTIYSYIRRVGDWKENTPDDIIKCKRNLDKTFHSTKPYWSKDTFNAYENFVSVCFKEYRGHAKNAGIIAKVERYRELENWDNSFEDAFESGYNRDKLIQVNNFLMTALSKDFGLS
ncbi:TPA: hypothetical protein ACX6PR_000986 [Photobacterium damselae]